MNNAFAAGAVCLGVGLVIGLWQGSSNAGERYERWLMAADLPDGCRRLLYDAADDLNAEAEDRARAGDRQ